MLVRGWKQAALRIRDMLIEEERKDRARIRKRAKARKQKGRK